MKELITDEDMDALGDYICDICVCRDGYGGVLCDFFNQGVGMTNELERNFREIFRIPRGDPNIKEMPECHKPGINTAEHKCSTNSYLKSDTDGDLLADICEKHSEKFNNKLRCYEGPITNPDGRTIGYVHKEKFLNDDGYMCVFALCTDKALKFDDFRLFKKHCDDVWKIDNGMTELSASEKEMLLEQHKG
jgi:hypothetical protein